MLLATRPSKKLIICLTLMASRGAKAVAKVGGAAAAAQAGAAARSGKGGSKAVVSRFTVTVNAASAAPSPPLGPVLGQVGFGDCSALASFPLSPVLFSAALTLWSFAKSSTPAPRTSKRASLCPRESSRG